MAARSPFGLMVDAVLVVRESAMLLVENKKASREPILSEVAEFNGEGETFDDRGGNRRGVVAAWRRCWRYSRCGFTDGP